jgi:hypothetical protein
MVGKYLGRVRIGSNDPLRPLKTVPCRLSVVNSTG